jgi:hypothetical protein
MYYHDRKDAKNEFKISGKSKKGPFYAIYGLFPLFSILLIHYISNFLFTWLFSCILLVRGENAGGQ